MKYDMNFLSTDLGKELCDLMTLSSSDLQCIVFAQGRNTNSNNENSNNNTMSSIRTSTRSIAVLAGNRARHLLGAPCGPLRLGRLTQVSRRAPRLLPKE